LEKSWPTSHVVAVIKKLDDYLQLLNFMLMKVLALKNHI